MNRSEINTVQKQALDFFRTMKFMLPPWAHWLPEDWKLRRDTVGEIVRAGLGWDITDFGGGDFHSRGLILLTLRNGIPANVNSRKPYCEKIMIVEENQETPMHFHGKKIEDIINRGGGNLVIELYGSTGDDGLAETPVNVAIDGISRLINPGDRVVLTPGESITLEQRVYHRFYGTQGHGRVLVGEVSTVNDDKDDNHFYAAAGRFTEIIEDEHPLHLLVSDYGRLPM